MSAKTKVIKNPPNTPTSPSSPSSSSSSTSNEEPVAKKGRGRPSTVQDWNVKKKESNDKYNEKRKTERAVKRLKETMTLLTEMGMSKSDIIALIV